MPKILIITNHFSPEINPRSFRSTELARELSKHANVTVLSPCPYNKDVNGDHFKHIQVVSTSSPSPIQKLKTLPTRRKKILAKILHFFLPGGLDSLFFLNVFKVRKNIEKQYDAIISIGLPIGIHLASFLTFHFLTRSKKLIYDYGDPFSDNPHGNYSPLNRLFEKILLSPVDRVIVPVVNAKAAFKGLISLDKIEVIPQGLDFSQFSIDPYIKTNPPKALYAGMFYEKIRDPDSFMKSILSLPDSFELHLQTDMNLVSNARIIERYMTYDIHKRLKIIPIANRADCIKKMATYDFVINFANISETQNPSKLIDYTLSKRPILNVRSSENPTQEFVQFLNGQYETQVRLENFSEYDIAVIGNKVLKIVNS